MRVPAPAVLICGAFSVFVLLHAAPANADRRQLVNAAEVHAEIVVAPANEAAVRQYFPSFLDYQDLIMFHPKFGYYASGRVSFTNDYQTFPIVLAPYFGQMIAEHVFHMWQGMRQAGTLGTGERFTIAEFGAGNGMMAESILDYVAAQAKSSSDPRWGEFSAQLVYVCYDRSSALSRAQRERNARFGNQFEAREGDATEPTATVPPGSLKGVVVSNELPDAFSVHKVVLSLDGSAEVAFVAPAVPAEAWQKLEKKLPPQVLALVTKDDEAIKSRLFSGKKESKTYLSRAAFVALLEWLVSFKDYEAAIASLEFHEIYLPAGAIPELADHLRRYARVYGGELAKSNRGVVTYINLGAEKFIQGSGRILKAGYILTIDYGANWDGILAPDSHPHLRTYGPAHQEENAGGAPEIDPATGDLATERDTSDPYRGPTLNDITTDVNFSLLAEEGKLAGLTTSYFGSQWALASGTDAPLDTPPAHRKGDDGLLQEYNAWLKDFRTDANFKIMVQQKEKTDDAYVYPDQHPEPLGLTDGDLSPAQRQKAAEIIRKLGAVPVAALRK